MADNDMMATLMGVLEPPTPVVAETPVGAPVTPATPSEPQVVIRDTQEPQETPVEVTVTETVEEPLDEFMEAETPEQLFKGITDPNSPRLQQAWDAYKFAVQLAKSPEEGGIGHEPTIEDIRQYHDDHVTITEMITDFETNPAKFMTGMTRVNPLAMAQMVESIPDIIDNVASAAPEIQAAYSKLSNKIANNLVEDLLDKARAYAESNPEAKKWYFLTARNLKYFLSDGTVKLDDGAMKASAPVDPFAEERARLKAEREEIENERRTRASESWKGFINSAVTEVESKVIEGFAWPDELKAKHGSFMDTLNKDALTRVKQSIGNIPIAKQEKSVANSDKQTELTRAEKIQKNGCRPLLPDVGDAEYVITYWQDLGMVEMGAMGPVPLSAREILSWQECTGVELSAWEYRAIKQMSQAYLMQAKESEKPECEPPYGDPVNEFDRTIVSKKVSNAFKAFIQAKR